MNRFVLWFVKITGFPIQLFYYKKKIYYKNKESIYSNKNEGAILISNHTSVFDYPLMMYTFFNKNIRVLVAKSTASKSKLFYHFIQWLGGVIVDRQSFDFAFTTSMVELAKRGDYVLIYPEGRLPTDEELLSKQLLPFKSSFVYIALESGIPVIPIYINGSYGKNKKKVNDTCKVVIGEKLYLRDLTQKDKSNKENIDYLCGYVRDYIKLLGEEINEKK